MTEIGGNDLSLQKYGGLKRINRITIPLLPYMHTSPAANNKKTPVQIRHNATDHKRSQKSRQHRPIQYNPRISD